jgi:hypothetical protein
MNNAIRVNPLVNNRFRESACAKSHERYGDNKILITIPDKHFYPLAKQPKPKIEDATDFSADYFKAIGIGSLLGGSK